MSDERSVEQRLEALEARIDQLAHRLDRMEQGRDLRPESLLIPPPFIGRPAEVFEAPDLPSPTPEEVVVQESRPRLEVPSSPSIEYQLGAKVLPWVGGIVVLVAVGFLVAAAIDRGFLTPWMQFGLGILTSVAFLVVGWLKREEREQFGLLLMSTGSCGVFLSLVGGHTFHSLYSAEMLVGSFLAWGLLNLGFGAVSGSTTFVILGFLGSWAAALMPLQRGNATLSLALYGFVAVAATMVAWRHRWVAVQAFVWSMSLIANLLIGLQLEDTLLAVSVFGGISLLAAGVFAAITDVDSDSMWLPMVVLFCAVFAGWVYLAEVERVGFLVALGVLCAGGAWIHRAQHSVIGFWSAAYAAVWIAAPTGLQAVPAFLWYWVGAMAMAGFLWRRQNPNFLWLGWLQVLMAILAYGVALLAQPPLAPELELGLLALLAGAMVAMIVAGRSWLGSSRGLVVLCVLLFPVYSRMLFQSATLFGSSLLGAAQVMLLGWAVFLGLLGWLDRDREIWIRSLAWHLLALTIFVYTSVGEIFRLAEPALDLPFLLVMGVSVVLIARGTARYSEDKQVAASAAGILLVGVLVRILTVSMGRFDLGLTSEIQAILSWGIPASAALVFAWRTGWLSGLVSGWVAYVPFLLLTLGVPDLQRSPLLDGGAILLTLFLTILSWGQTPGRRLVVVVSLILQWVLISRAAAGAVHGPGEAISDWTTTGAWIGFATILMIWGAWRDLPLLRYCSMAVFASTLFKVFFVDLAERIDPLARVAILIVLGLVMLAGGYWYIRNQNLAESPRKPESEGSTEALGP
ncbi:MAG TPA: DUF2339 domain-containing protein [Fimbriimonadaceae bacterium]|nr:DUF2339 domain-containing protein [Fimbriimonadaceae bacterium]HRJ32687.1 DUF2339 domain-containing protein [Fimbriimonadaceae bacterium]